jgi:putative Ca2+/H+ antiporter (TMEM165/GDT1 family)
MDFKLFLTTFITIFIAELGDKTQFAAIAAGSKAQSIWPVLFGVVMGLGLAGVLGVLFGKGLSQFINPQYMHYVSGGLFIAVGIWILVSK